MRVTWRTGHGLRASGVGEREHWLTLVPVPSRSWRFLRSPPASQRMKLRTDSRGLLEVITVNRPGVV